jgi:hypothetical protein
MFNIQVTNNIYKNESFVLNFDRISARLQQAEMGRIEANRFILAPNCALFFRLEKYCGKWAT